MMMVTVTMGFVRLRGETRKKNTISLLNLSVHFFIVILILLYIVFVFLFIYS